MNKKIIIQIPFNVQGFNKENELNEEWIDYRLKLFIGWNVKSLKAQTNQWFTALLRCRDETLEYIKERIERLIPENVFIVGVKEYHEKTQELIKGYEYLYQVRMDSDDLYEKNFIDLLHNFYPKPETEVLISQRCYTHDINQGRLAYFHYASPQSYVLIYKTPEYRLGKRHILKNGHGGAILLKHELLSGINYMDTVHKKNDSSYFEAGKGGKKDWSEIEDKNDIREILKDFGIAREETNETEKAKNIISH